MSGFPSSVMAASLENPETWLFLSPHLDDAVLSCGALMAAEASKRWITVATLFTECGPAPHTRAAKSFLRQCSANDADALFNARRTEDAEVLTDLGVRYLHFGAPDALFRRREQLLRTARLGKALPELMHRYPTYRYDIAVGRVSRGDRPLLENLQAQAQDLAALIGAKLVFCPVGIGRHVDHLLTRTVGEGLDLPVVYYSDFPYNLRQQPDAAFLRNRKLKAHLWWQGIEEKRPRVRQYATQVGALFPDGQIPAVPEMYFA